jgi:hypothetical protein
MKRPLSDNGDRAGMIRINRTDGASRTFNHPPDGWLKILTESSITSFIMHPEEISRHKKCTSMRDELYYARSIQPVP